MDKKLKSIIVLLILLIGILITKDTYATSGFSVSTSSKEVYAGDTTTFNIIATECGGKFKIESSDTSVVTISESSPWIEAEVKTITITAKKEGNATITITAENVSDLSGENDIEGFKTIQVNVIQKNSTSEPPVNQNNNNSNNNKPTKSKDATLKGIWITPKQYDFSGFSPNKTEYTTKVPSNVNSLEVRASTTNEKATYTVTGNKDLKEGTNLIKVLVTAEDGTQKTYTIRVTKLAQEDNLPGNIDEGKEIFLTSLGIEGLEITPEFKSNIFSYQLKVDKDVTKLDIKPKANVENAVIEITGNNELKTGENIVNILVKTADGSKTVTYQILVEKLPASEDEPLPEENINEPTVPATTEPEQETDEMSILQIGIIVATVLTLIVIILIIIKRRKSKREEDIPSYEAFNFNHDDNDIEDEEPKFRNNIIMEPEQIKSKEEVSSVDEKEQFLNNFTKQSIEDTEYFNQYKRNNEINSNSIDNKADEKNQEGYTTNKFSSKLTEMFDEGFDDYEKRKKGKHF